MPSFAHAREEAAAAALAARCGDLSQVIFLNTGSEAVHLACRTARIATGRGRIVKFAAAYDGWYDPVAFGNTQSPAARMTGARPERDGMLLLRYNDFADVERLFAEYDDIAAILMEPVLANAGCLEPAPGYLQYVTDRAHRNGALVILDEVLMGFRLHAGLTGHYLGVDADLAAVGKAIGTSSMELGGSYGPGAEASDRQGHCLHGAHGSNSMDRGVFSTAVVDCGQLALRGYYQGSR